MTMRHLPLLVFSLLNATPVFAQEPVGCDKFKWPLDRERALLASASSTTPGSEVAQPPGAFKLSLAPIADAKLPMAPTRAPKQADSNAGFVRVPALAKPGIYRITLSEGAWIDVFQDGHGLKSGAFSGVTGCEGVRKSVKFDLSAAPFVIEISGTTAASISIAITQD
jgi:hypothetical protein